MNDTAAPWRPAVLCQPLPKISLFRLFPPPHRVPSELPLSIPARVREYGAAHRLLHLGDETRHQVYSSSVYATGFDAVCRGQRALSMAWCAVQGRKGGMRRGRRRRSGATAALVRAGRRCRRRRRRWRPRRTSRRLRWSASSRSLAATALCSSSTLPTSRCGPTTQLCSSTNPHPPPAPWAPVHIPHHQYD